MTQGVDSQIKSDIILKLFKVKICIMIPSFSPDNLPVIAKLQIKIGLRKCKSIILQNIRSMMLMNLLRGVTPFSPL